MRWTLALLVSAALFAGCPAGNECESAADCNDSNACTEDACLADGCQNLPVEADDNNPCTIDSCDPASGPVHQDDPAINDNNACTVDSCDPLSGSIAHDPVEVDDNNACTTDSCDPQSGAVSHEPVNVNDNNACTTDSCNAATGIVSHEPINLDDGNACTVDACDPVTGVSHDPVAGIDDGNACTADACDPVTGTISHAAVNVNDNNACTVDACDPVTGLVSHDLVSVDDGNACTTDACNAATGNVTHTPVNVDDGVNCTDDACDPATGIVTHSTDDSLCADLDGASCSVPRCDAVLDCVEDLDDGVCSDGQACTTADICDPGGVGSDAEGCRFVADNAVCGDGVACTDDLCSPFVGCSSTPDNGNCNSGEVCDPAQNCVALDGVLAEGVISEFVSLGFGLSGEMVEVFNPGTSAGDLRGGVLINRAGQTAVIRAVSDPTGANGTPVNVPAGAFAVGFPNPSNPANIPAVADFVYGEPGLIFEMADLGDTLEVRNRNGLTLDTIDFSFNNLDTLPSAPVVPGAFTLALGKVSTQLDPTHLNTTDNDDGDNWCLSFHVLSTPGEANLSCSPTTVVINEVMYDGGSVSDPSDGSRSFIELAGPGGARIADLRLRGVEGEGSEAGSIQAPNVRIGDLLPDARMPSTNVLVITDNTNGPFQSIFAPDFRLDFAIELGADTFENGSDSLQLLFEPVGGPVSLVDVVGYADAGGIQDPDDDVDLFPTFEGTPVLDTAQGTSLTRGFFSEDTNNNAADFVLDPSPSPGIRNVDGTRPFVEVLDKNDGLANLTTEVVIFGVNLGADATISFAGTPVPPDACDFTLSPHQVRCEIPPGILGRGDIVYTNTIDRGGLTDISTDAWTYTGVLNETNVAGELDFCNVQFPATLTVPVNTPSDLVFGQIFEAGLTEGPNSFLSTTVAEGGFGPLGTNPLTNSDWFFQTAIPNVEVGNNDEYKVFFAFRTLGTFSYVYRFSFDQGINFTYCDLNGAGSNFGLTFEANQLGTVTVQ